MTDATLVFRPGDRLTDETGAIISGGTVEFYDAGTSTPRTVYSDSGLSTSLGTTVDTDSSGYPVSGAVKTLIYTGSTAYKVVLKDADAATIWSHDSIAGALDTSSFITSSSGAIVYTVTALTTPGTWVVGDVEGVAFSANPAGGDFVRTLPLASTATGVPFRIKHTGTSGIVTLLAQGADVIVCDGRDTARKAMFLTQRGDSLELISDGVNWQAYFIATKPGPLSFAVESVGSAPAGSPTVGLAYLVTGSPSGVYLTTTPAVEANDVVVYDGQSNYQIFRPSADCGWRVYDKATGDEYLYKDTTWTEFDARVAAAIGFDPVESVRLGTSVTEAQSLTTHTIGDQSGNVLTATLVTVNTENYYLQHKYRPLQIKVAGAWSTVSSI